MNNQDPRKYYNEECYALTNCMHCPDCLAFGIRYFNQVGSKEKDNKTKSYLNAKNIVIKFIISTISAEKLPCKKALSSKDLRKYIDQLLSDKAELPICHYEFR